jgi:hypothetical protein
LPDANVRYTSGKYFMSIVIIWMIVNYLIVLASVMWDLAKFIKGKCFREMKKEHMTEMQELKGKAYLMRLPS